MNSHNSIMEWKIELDTTEAAEQTPRNIRTSQRSMLTVGLMTFTLCFAAAAVLILKTPTKSSGPDEESFELHHMLRQISNTRAAIHLEGEHNSSVKTSVEWTAQVDQYHAEGGLELRNNEIVIPRSGLYFVYSQASFRVSCSSSKDDVTSDPMVHLSHAVKRWSSSFGSDYNEESYQTILHSVRTACQKTTGGDPDLDGNWFSAVYMGAVFRLQAGDHLKTVMEEKMLEMLEDEPGKTFFGVFAL